MTAPQSPLYRVLGLLDGVKKQGTGYTARCPGTGHARGDKHASLSVGTGYDGAVLLKCFTGCETEGILNALGLEWADLYEQSSKGNPVRRFRIMDQSGKVLAEHVREDLPDGQKDIRWQRNGKNGLGGLRTEDLPLYRLSDVLTSDQPVIVCEGETSADALAGLGLLAVSTVTGAAGTPSTAVLEPLKGREVWLWPDNDDEGRSHMARIALKLPGAKWIVWPEAPAKGDAADYVKQGGTAEGVAALVRATYLSREHQNGTGTHLDIIRMSEVQPEPIEWHWRGRLARGKPTLMMGDPGLGKSLITHWMAAKTSRGGEWPDGGVCERGAAILFTVEDALGDTVAPRLLAAGADMDRVYAVRGVIENSDDHTSRMFALMEHLALLERLIVETGAIFVVMDPVSAYLGPDVNSHREADVRMVLGPLQLLTERTRIALAMLMHLNKGTGVSALYRASGSIAFPAVARVVLGVAPDPNDDSGRRRLLLPIKMNIGKLPDGIGYRIETFTPNEGKQPILRHATVEDQPPILVWDDDPVTIDVASAMDRNASSVELGAVAEAKQAMLDILSSGRVPATECKRQIRESTGVTGESTLSRARRELGVTVRKEGYQGTWYWELPQRISNIPIPRENESLKSLDYDAKFFEDPPRVFGKVASESKDSKDSPDHPKASHPDLASESKDYQRLQRIDDEQDELPWQEHIG